MKNIVDEFINTKKQLNQYFNCSDDFFIKPLIENKWTIKDNNGTFFLFYFDSNKNQKESVIVKKNSQPIILKTDEHTMIIGIECVKLAFILKNENQF